jgi:hypothetical protein
MPVEERAPFSSQIYLAGFVLSLFFLSSSTRKPRPHTVPLGKRSRSRDSLQQLNSDLVLIYLNPLLCVNECMKWI